jgi:hypothetical protein
VGATDGFTVDAGVGVTAIVGFGVGACVGSGVDLGVRSGVAAGAGSAVVGFDVASIVKVVDSWPAAQASDRGRLPRVMADTL